MIKKIFLLFFTTILLTLTACQVDPNPCSLSEDTWANLQVLDSMIQEPEVLQWDRREKKQLYDEPSLLDATTETYRFIWHSSFDGSEVYRIEEKEGQYQATIKRFPDDPDSTAVIRTFYITEETWSNIRDNLANNRFWVYPYAKPRNGLDGSTWLIEGYKPIQDECSLNHYQRLGKWSPIDKRFIAMAELFFALSEK